MERSLFGFSKLVFTASDCQLRNLFSNLLTRLLNCLTRIRILLRPQNWTSKKQNTVETATYGYIATEQIVNFRLTLHYLCTQVSTSSSSL